jgi:hypothetical protein
VTYDLSHATAANLLSDSGVTFVIAQSRLLPMPEYSDEPRAAARRQWTPPLR